jgi:uncharacterized protein YrrD
MADVILQFEHGMKVMEADGDVIGHIERVVVNPFNLEVTHVIVEKGLFFNKSHLLPVDMIERTTDEEVFLNIAADGLELAEFDDDYYINVDDVDESMAFQTYPQGYARPLFSYPPVGSRDSYPNEVLSPVHGVDMLEGRRVVGATGDHIGNVERVFVDPDTERATHILISSGILLQREKVVPIGWVEAVIKDVIRLGVTETWLDRLPDFDLNH